MCLAPKPSAKLPNQSRPMAISVTVHPLQGQTLATSPAGLDLLTTLLCHGKNVLDFLSSSKTSETSNTFQIWDHRPLSHTKLYINS